jgi:hypothetical protein
MIEAVVTHMGMTRIGKTIRATVMATTMIS